jgi:hypothetical protein
MKRKSLILLPAMLAIVLAGCAKAETTVKESPKPQEKKPVEIKNDPNVFPIYSDVYSGGLEVEFSHLESKPSAKVRVYIWEGTCSVKKVDEDPFAGNECLSIVAKVGTWFGFGFHKVNPGSQNMQGFEKGHLKFAIKAAPGAGDVKVLIKHSYSTESWLNLDDYGFKADNQWHQISIPLSDFIPAVNFKDVNIFFGMAQGKKFVPGSKYWLDEIYWTKD